MPAFAPTEGFAVRHDVFAGPSKAPRVTLGMQVATVPACRFLRALHQLPCRLGRLTLRKEWQRLLPNRVRNADEDELPHATVASTLSTYKGLITAGVNSTALSTIAETSSRYSSSSTCQIIRVSIIQLRACFCSGVCNHMAANQNYTVHAEFHFCGGVKLSMSQVHKLVPWQTVC